MSALSTRILAHMVDAVAASPAANDPFPHVVIPNFFPADAYADLMQFLPANDEYEVFSYEKHQTKDGQSNRLRYRMEDQWLNRLSGEQRAFWYAVRQAFGAPQLKEAVFDKLHCGVCFRFGLKRSAVNEIEAHALPELFRELSSYRIKPHPDTRRKVITMQISLPDDDSQHDLGTEFYKRSLNPLHLAREPYGFEIVKRMPFLRNTAYAFSVLNNITWKSWHGRSTLPPASGVRNSLLNIWYLQEADANTDIRRQKVRAAA